MNIADFGGFAGIARMIKLIKETGHKLTTLSETTGVKEILDLKLKYIDALDKFRPGNTQGVASIMDEFDKDVVHTIGQLRSKITDSGKLAEAEKTLNECTSAISGMLNIVRVALDNEAKEKAKKAG
ncbi:MAG: hypothetical protein KBD64_06770 [Gammaproteobacteria bacterium]|nr:hypothetical protein [Gammaproteobacteria bacterium]